MGFRDTNKEVFEELIRTKQISILLVDDSKVNQFLGKRILQNLGLINVSLSGNGLEALDLIKSTHFDVLLTDVEMPGLNGYQLSKEIRKIAAFDELVIIALTANTTSEDKALAVEAGINDYLTKPYSPHDLMDKLMKHLLDRKEVFMQELSSIQQKEIEPGILNIYSIFHNDRNDIKKFLSMLSMQIPELITKINLGLINDDIFTAFQAAHKLKSPVSLLAKKEVSDELSNFTEMLRTEGNGENNLIAFKELAPKLESILVLVNLELEKII